MSPTRRTAVAAGVFFLITEIAAIAGLVLYRPALTDADYVLGAAPTLGCCSAGSSS
ncbi:hypothetical protein [Micromonospora sp. 4G55]|uniref:hypothetical protein n=1 Tax=Micromonospora sp. 4G55 TaxID=2806102 RepID=UPI001A6333A7|nr:hypothetical protein [Micromonospora sp. 4G55]MBM0258264.1 hypothetical protein [Micromonospora sp. 4G55]